jgi:hypothetical protein
VLPCALRLRPQSKPLRLVPPFTLLDIDDAHADEIVCTVDKYVVMNFGANATGAAQQASRPRNYYLAIKGGTVCGKTTPARSSLQHTPP